MCSPQNDICAGVFGTSTKLRKKPNPTKVYAPFGAILRFLAVARRRLLGNALQSAHL